MTISERQLYIVSAVYAFLWLIVQPIASHLSLVVGWIDNTTFYKLFFPASLVQIVIGVAAILIFRKRYRLGWAGLYLAIAGWMAVVVLLHYSFDPPLFDANGTSIDYFNSRVIFYSLAQFFCATVFASRKPPKTGTFVAWIGMLGYVWISLDSALRFDFGDLSRVEASSIYLMYGDSFALVSLVALRVANRTVIKVLIFSISIFFLWAIQSRTSLYIFIAAVAFNHFYLIERVYLRWAFLIFIILITLALITSVHVYDGPMLAILDLASDSSFNSRMVQVGVGFSQIASHPIFGSYEGVARAFGGFGQYIHGVFSYWQIFGLVPFLLVIALLFLSGRRYIAGRNGSEMGGWSTVVLFALGCALFSRAYIFAFVPIIAGVLAALPRGSRR